ncbi:hypothetical protein H072_10749 [Dactylellina haptotyla CBS 200.50]|uniref:Uncharacterized protein n=1 Tax=Dactylellina haptotyla (strain CBS 200.50) TaxID=1284197 RepID=S7ZYP7_DACHA|nr:hypothetical protein H072_10749 [Dactylellina haptotyla CBS 200.50]
MFASQKILASPDLIMNTESDYSYENESYQQYLQRLREGGASDPRFRIDDDEEDEETQQFEMPYIAPNKHVPGEWRFSETKGVYYQKYPQDPHHQRALQYYQTDKFTPASPTGTMPLRFLNLAGYTDAGTNKRFFYPAGSYRFVDIVPDGVPTPPATPPCICANTQLMDELGINVKLSCVHSGDMNKFWKVMGRDSDLIGTDLDRSNSSKPRGGSNGRPDTAATLSSSPTLTGEDSPLEITVTKTILVEVQNTFTAKVDSSDGKNVYDVCCDSKGSSNERLDTAVTEKSFWGHDAFGYEADGLDEEKRRTFTGGLPLPTRERGMEGRLDSLRQSVGENKGFLKKAWGKLRRK